MSRFQKYCFMSAILGLAWVVLFPATARAIVVNADETESSNPAQYQTKPGPSFNVWDHVGALGNGSGVYLGNGFVLTANHVTQFSTFNLNGVDYARNNAEPAIRLKNPDNSNADLKLFQINGDPGLPMLPISADTVALTQPVVMIGTGRGRATAEQSVGPGLTGYQWTASNVREKTWATNNVAGTTTFSDKNNTHLFPVRFDSFADGDGQAAEFDSGGGIFRYNLPLTQWELIGVPVSIGTFEDQDPQTAAYGNTTNIADLSIYRDQIVAVIPEPASVALLCSGAMLALTTRRR